MSTTTFLADPLASWPIWDGSSIVLYHGTTQMSAQNIKDQGAQISECRENTDFGRGLYTTSWRQQAEQWSRQKARYERIRLRRTVAPAVLKLVLDRRALGALSTIAFVRGELDAIDFWSFVSHCRDGRPHFSSGAGYYDVAYGPVTTNWHGPASSGLRPGFDQISFHTQAAIDLLADTSVCQQEVL